MADEPEVPLNNSVSQVDMEKFQFMELVHNVLESRSDLINKYLDPRRDVLLECGHPTTGEITPEHYAFLFDRCEIATRVVQVMPKECFAELPEIYEDEDVEVDTEFELAWKDLGQSLRGNSSFKATEGAHPIWEYVKRADEQSGIGQFGVMLLGFDDLTEGDGGKTLKDPVDGVEEFLTRTPKQIREAKKKNAKKKEAKKPPIIPKTATTNIFHDDEDEEDTEEKPEPEVPKPETVEEEEKPVIEAETWEGKHSLLFVRVFPQNLVQITQYESDRGSPRYGQPKEYLLTFNDPNNNNMGGGIDISQQNVHWTRIIHVADNLSSSEIFGVPRMRPVYNRLMDCMKLHGGSAEMYWRGAFPGFALETHPQLGGDVVVDHAAIRSQMTNYMNKLQRYISLMGMSAKSLAPQVSDPTAQINVQIEAICIQLAIPKRIFVGSERGELASSEDEGQWTERVEERQKNYLIPKLIVPLVDRLIAADCLPEPEEGYCCEWPTLETESELDKATVAKTKTEALSAYIGGGVDALIAPMDYLTLILGLTDDEAKNALDNAVDHINESNPDLNDVTVPGAHPEPPPPEIPQSPIKMKDGEKLVAPDETNLPGKPKGKGVPPQFVKNEEVLDDEEDFFEDAQDDVEPIEVANRGNVPTDSSNSVTDNPVVSEVVNYNPNQPRDSQGQFGSGGGGSSGGSWTPKESSKEAIEALKELGVGPVGFRGYKTEKEELEAINDLGVEISRLTTDHPGIGVILKTKPVHITLTNTGWIHGTENAAQYFRLSGKVEVGYNSKEKEAVTLKGQFATTGKNGNLRHELGHHISSSITGSGGANPLADRIGFSKALGKDFGVERVGPTYKDKESSKAKKSISKYAATNREEAFAESFAAYTSPDYNGGLPSNVEAYFKKLSSNTELVQNYNPSQPRDSHGRFGSGGGSGGGGSIEQGPPESFKKFATDAEKKELNKLAKERNDLNKKVKDGTATEAERVKAVMVKRRIAELKDIADARGKGIDPPVKPVIEVKPIPKIEIEKPKPIIPPVESFSKTGGIRDKVNNHKELEDLRQSVVNTSRQSDHTKTRLEAAEAEQKSKWNALMDHDSKNRSDFSDEDGTAHILKRNQLKEAYDFSTGDRWDADRAHKEALDHDRREVHKVLQLDRSKRIKITGTSTLGSKEHELKLRVMEGRSFVESMTSKDLGVSDLNIGVRKIRSRTGRSQFSYTTINGKLTDQHLEMASGAETRAVVHEYTHGVEHAVPSLYNKCVEFRESRIREAGSSSINFRKKHGRGYKANEVGNKDTFDKFFKEDYRAEYVGKNYGAMSGATEILTMGMEAVYTDPVGFATKDPEFFKFVVGVTRGAI